MDNFYQLLRKVQKKERNNGTLTRVEETFYNDIHEYMNVLKKEAMNDPFSKAPAMLKEAQRIATEICQRREIKITNSAVLNIHRSYRLFTGKPQFDLVDTTPLNLTPEEEKFYYSLIDTLKNHRNNISLEKLSGDDEVETENKTIIKPPETQSNTLDSQFIENDSKIPSKSDDVEPIIKPKDEAEPVIKPKKDIKSVTKPVNKHETQIRDEKPIIKPKSQPKPIENIEENPNAFNPDDEFFDFESKKIAKDTELVTMLVFDDVGAIMGVDEKIYGPFRPQDIVTLPLVNAKIFFKNRKGRQVKI